MKNKRHRMIREIVENQNIETQLQLTQELRKFGFDVTQATISRDIKELDKGCFRREYFSIQLADGGCGE